MHASSTDNSTNQAFASPEEYEILVPLVKSVVDPHTGEIKLTGIATDEKVDVDKEIVKASAKPSVLDYLNAAGVLNYDHGRDIIGKVTGARFIDNAEAMSLFGRPIVGVGIHLDAKVNPILDPSITPADLKTVHYLVKSGMPLFFSIEGTRESQTMGAGGIPITVPGFITKVAITAQPRNTNAFCTIAKSLGQVVPDMLVDESLPGLMVNNQSPDEVAASENDGTPKRSRVVYIGSVSTEIVKAMATTGIVATTGTTGADACKVEALDGNVANQATRSCPLCGAPRKKKRSGKSVKKSLSAPTVSTMVSDLMKLAR